MKGNPGIYCTGGVMAEVRMVDMSYHWNENEEMGKLDIESQGPPIPGHPKTSGPGACLTTLIERVNHE